MTPAWTITNDDVRRTKDFVRSRQQDALVKNREKRNLLDPKVIPSRDDFWHALVACLLTTQQRSGPTSPISKLIGTTPFPLAYSACCAQADPSAVVLPALRGVSGIRRFNKITEELVHNLRWLESGNWQAVQDAVVPLLSADDAEVERRAARYIDRHLLGFGPKQARNLLQSLGLTRYEIPLDSRILKWLAAMWAPFRVSSCGLSDPDVYEFLLDGVQELCRRCGLYPCILDAAIFSSFDGDGWNVAKVIW